MNDGSRVTTPNMIVRNSSVLHTRSVEIFMRLLWERVLSHNVMMNEGRKHKHERQRVSETSW